MHVMIKIDAHHRYECQQRYVKYKPYSLFLWLCGQEIKRKFGADVDAAAAGQLSSWREGYNALALIILSDQFPRCAYCLHGSK